MALNGFPSKHVLFLRLCSSFSNQTLVWQCQCHQILAKEAEEVQQVSIYETAKSGFLSSLDTFPQESKHTDTLLLKPHAGKGKKNCLLNSQEIPNMFGDFISRSLMNTKLMCIASFLTHHQLNGHEFEQIPGDIEGQGSLACGSPWGCKESDANQQLNNNNKSFLNQGKAKLRTIYRFLSKGLLIEQREIPARLEGKKDNRKNNNQKLSIYLKLPLDQML